jgi:hypothetical protein
MKRRFAIPTAVFIACTLSALTAGISAAQLTLPRPSPAASVTQTIGLTECTVTCSRPGVKGRVIWGGLVPYDQVWRTGANEATTFNCSRDVKIEGRPLAAGRYAIFTVPGPDAWSVRFNSEPDQRGTADYDSTKDVLTLEVKPREAEFLERMRFSFENMTDDGGDLVLRWEKLELPLHIDVDVVTPVIESTRAALDSLEADDWRTPYRAAEFLYDRDVHADLATEWAGRSTQIQGNHANLSLLAKLAARAGNMKDAIALAKKAIKVGKASKDSVDTSATEKLLAEWQKR